MGEIRLLSISFANLNDIRAIQGFIATEYVENHILFLSKELLLWQYFDYSKSQLNFVLAKNQNEVIGILGYTNYAQYVQTATPVGINWLSMWKVKQPYTNGLGLKLLSFLQNNDPDTPVGTVGCNERAKKIYELLGYEVGTLSHFVVISKALLPQLQGSDCQIFELTTGVSPRAYLFSVDRLRVPDFINSLKNSQKIFSFGKPPSFFIGRYLNCPVYEYHFLGIKNLAGEALGFMIYRIAESPLGRVIRILEIKSENFDLNIALSVMELLKNLNAAYADFYLYPVEEGSGSFMGMTKVNPPLEIPNLFEPFTKKMRMIHFAMDRKVPTAISISRGDGDQDRPFSFPHEKYFNRHHSIYA